MQEILVAVDGSKLSEQIVDSAIDLAKRTSLPALLVYVIKNREQISAGTKEVTVSSSLGGAPIALEEVPEGIKEYEKMENFRDFYANYLQEVGNSVTAKLAQKFANEKIPCRVVVQFGNPAERILELAKSEKSRFIVVGLKGLHGVARIRSLGSTSRRIVENAETPVLVVPST